MKKIAATRPQDQGSTGNGEDASSAANAVNTEEQIDEETLPDASPLEGSPLDYEQAAADTISAATADESADESIPETDANDDERDEDRLDETSLKSDKA